MRPTLTIADIYATPARAPVLRSLSLARIPLSTRGAGRAAGISHTAAASVLGDLESLGLVTRSNVGRAHAFTLNRDSVYVRLMVLPAVAAEDQVTDELCADLVDAFAADSLSLILFGSYAYGEQTESSDIDVFAIAQDARRKQQLEDKATERFEFFLSKFGSPLSLMAYSRREAAEYLAPGKSSLRNELASAGIILHGLGVEEWEIDDVSEGAHESGGPDGCERLPRESRGVRGLGQRQPRG
jgi:predicted nucleotidyltransferase